MAEAWTVGFFVSGIAWGVLKLAVAAVAAYRFRCTPAGIVLVATLLLTASKSWGNVLVRSIGLAVDHPVNLALLYGTPIVSFVAVAGFAVGVILIPLSLRRLGALRPEPPSDP